MRRRMSIRHSLLAMLNEGPKYGAQLRAEFESRTGATWPLNVGQVYTTLARLERDGLVTSADEDEAGHLHYRTTQAGSIEVDRWFHAPVPRDAPERDELVIKLALAVSVPGLDVRALVSKQRVATVGALQDYTHLKDRLMDDPDELPWLLVLDSLIYAAEAEVHWLDHVEARVARAAMQRAERAAERPVAATEKVSR